MRKRFFQSFKKFVEAVSLSGLLQLAALFSMLAAAGVVQAAGTINLPVTGQTTCYDTAGTQISCAGTGQDGEIQAGAAWPSPRFANNGNGTITDNLTGLIWPQDANAGPAACNPGVPKNWQGALDYAACLNANRYLGYSDWRLPNVIELKSLMNFGVPDMSAWLNTQGFINVKYASYFSSSNELDTAGGGAYEAWSVQFDFGAVGPVGMGPSTGPYAWCVRGSSSLPKTGQQWCRDSAGTGLTIPCAGTGQDGEIQAGAAWPSPRFTDNGDSTISDNLTGLIWTKYASTPGPTTCTQGVKNKSWQDALNYVACLNANSYLGYNDWRLPNINELSSIINFAISGIENWPTGQGFIIDVPSMKNSYWWSSTTQMNSQSSNTNSAF